MAKRQWAARQRERHCGFSECPRPSGLQASAMVEVRNREVEGGGALYQAQEGRWPLAALYPDFCKASSIRLSTAESSTVAGIA